MMTDTFYEMLKGSVLSRQDIAVEEVAIWLDLNITKITNAIKIFKSIEKNYHCSNDRDQSSNVFKGMCNSFCSGCSMPYTTFNYDLTMAYCSDIVLANLFKAISQTNVLDKYVLSAMFVSYAKKARSLHRDKIPILRRCGSQLLLKTIKKEIDLYEMFAKLVDILENKLTKKDQSLLS